MSLSRYGMKSLALLSWCIVMVLLAPLTVTAGSFQLQAQALGKSGASPSSHVQATSPGTRLAPIEVRPLPPDSRPYGASYGTWGARWWQWALSAPFGADPITDPDGSHCDYGQSGPVWFLAGSSGSTVVRSCTVPAGAALFFPLVNYYANYPCPPEFGFEPAPGQSLEDFLRSFAAGFIDGAANMAVEVDGLSLGDVSSFRGTSDLFLLDIDPSWQAADPCVTGDPQPAVVDGFWMMLAPLAPGAHTLHFHAEIPAFDFAVDVTYNLTVQPGGRGRGAIDDRPGAETSTWGLVKRLYK